MKVLITTDLYTVKTNGVVTSVNVLQEELEKQGHEIRILTLSQTAHTYQDGNVCYIASAPIGYIYPDVRMALTYRSSVIRQIIDWKPDVIHSQCEFFSYQFAKRIARKLDIPLIHTYHTLYEQYVPYLTHCKVGEKRIAGTLSRVRLRKADHLIAPTEKVAKALREYRLKNPVSVIPTGLRMEKHRQMLSAQERRELRLSLGIPEENRVILSLGRLGSEKNLDELLRYLSEMLTPEDKLTMLIVGDGPARQSLEKLTKKLGIAGHVIFTGQVKPSEVYRYYQLGDVFVSASTSETQGLTYIEAAANGLPLVCRKDPCLDDVLTDGKNGFTYTQELEFQERLRYVLDHPQWCETAGQYSREVAQRFTGQQFAAAIERIYLAEISRAG